MKVQSIDTDVFVLLLAYFSMELESTFNVFFKMATPSPKWYDIVHVINRKALLYMRLCHSFTALMAVIPFQVLMGKEIVHFFYAWMKSERKDELKKTFVRLGHIPESIESVDIFNVKSLVKDAYFGTSHNKTKSVSSFRKGQFVQSTSNDLKNLAPSSDSLYMQILIATDIADFEWLECAQNVLVPDPSLQGFIHKGGVHVPRSLPTPPAFDLKRFVWTYKCKKTKCT